MNLNEKLKSIKLPKGVAKVISQEKAAKDNLTYVRKRASGEIKPLETSYTRLNKSIGGGFEANTILTLSGLSGTGNIAL